MKRLISIVFLLGGLEFAIGINVLPSFPQKIRLIQNQHMDEWVDFYKYLHAHPELSLEEKNTANTLAKKLKEFGFEVTQNVGGFGIVGILKNGEGPTVMIRTDLDALPIHEKTGVPYASELVKEAKGQEVNLMHACGHDLHMTVWTATAQTLKELSNDWKGTLMMVGQPAEEIGVGAKAMIEDGLYQRFGVPDYGLAIHTSPTIEAGKIGYCSGYALANVDKATITVYGEGGHGAAPHMTKDPIVLASAIVMELQTIVSRNINPTDAAVISVGTFHGGTKYNVIPDQVEMSLTIRSYKEEVRDQLFEGIERVCKGTAISFGIPEDKLPLVEFGQSPTPSTYNDPELQAKLVTSFAKAIGIENVEIADPVMLGEDFGRYGRTPEDVPTVLYWLGGLSTEKKAASLKNGTSLPGLHSPFFAPDPKPAIEAGVATMTAAVIDLMNEE